MKRLFLCLIALIFMLTACNSSSLFEGTPANTNSTKQSLPLGEVHPFESFPEELSPELMDIISRSSEKDYDDLITKKDDLALFFRLDPLGSALSSIDVMDKWIAIECLRRKEQGSLMGFWYSIHKVSFGPGLLYVFYYPSGTRSHSIYVEKTLRKADFGSIKKGSRIDAVQAIDPATTQWLELAIDAEWREFDAFHLLQDGLLMIRYKKSFSSYVVNSAAFYEDFIERRDYEGLIEWEYDFTIREEDYPK